MAILTDAEKATLLQLIADSGLEQEPDNDVVANALKAARAKTVQVPKPFRIADILGLLSASSQDAVMDHPLGGEVIAKINAGDRTAIALYANTFARRSVITTQERDAILARLAQTEDSVVPEVSLFAEAFPGFSYVIEQTEGVASHDASGNPVVTQELTRVSYTTPTAALIAEARA